MRKYLLPLLVFGAIGTLVVIFVLANREDGGREPPPRERDKPQAEKTETKRESGSVLRSGGRDTPTSLDENRWLSELERALQREKLPPAAYNYKGRLCERIEIVLADEKLTANLLAAIRKYAIEERDPERRKLLLPILRVLTTEEATQIIEEEYYRTSDPEERIVLLEAMANPGHNLETASVWAVETAIHSEDPEHRWLAFQFFSNLDRNHEVVVGFAKQLYGLSTRPEQRQLALAEISKRAMDSKQARAFVRERIRHPRETELMLMTDTILAWGTERDAAQLEALIGEFPALGDPLRQTVEQIRQFRRQEREMKKTEARDEKEKSE